MKPNKHRVSESIVGHTCHLCDRPATHKVGEEPEKTNWPEFARKMLNNEPQTFTMDDMPRHNLTTWLCCFCFSSIMGPRTQPTDAYCWLDVMLGLDHE